MVGEPLTIAQWARFYEVHGVAPFPFAIGGEETPPKEDDPPKPKPVTFESQEKLDQIIEREKGKAAEAAKKDPEFLATLRETIKGEIAAEQTRTKKQSEGEFEKLLDDTLNLKSGAIPDDSALGKAMTTLHAKVKTFSDTFQTIIETRLEDLPEEMRDLMPDGLEPDKQVAWIDKALKVKPKGDGKGEEKPPKQKTNGLNDPKPKGDVGLKVDDVIKELQGLGIYHPR